MYLAQSQIKEVSTVKRAELPILFFIRHATTASSWPGCWSLSVQGTITRWLCRDLCSSAVPSCHCPCTCCTERKNTHHCSQAREIFLCVWGNILLKQIFPVFIHIFSPYSCVACAKKYII